MKKLQDFTVYLKNGKKIEVKNVILKLVNAKPQFWDEFGELEEQVYIPLLNIAAVVPTQEIGEGGYLTVYLKEGEFKIAADSFRMTDDEHIEFMRGYIKVQPLFIDFSEINGIVASAHN